MPAKPVLLQLFPLPAMADADRRLADDYEVIPLWLADDPDATIAARRDDIVAIVTGGSAATPGVLMDKLPALKAICSLGVGYDAIDVDHAARKGIQVSNTPEVLNDCVADLAWGLILATARRMGQAERYVRADRWARGEDLPFATKVSGKKLGILGMGRVGMAIAERSPGFKMTVRYHNRRARPDAPWEYEESLLALAGWADILVIATVGGPSTRHLVDRSVLEALGPQGLLINVSRGSVVDEAALVQALLDGKLGAAGLDVFENEPHIPDEIKHLDNVVALPHIGSATVETRSAMVDLVVRNAHAFATTGEVITPVA